MGRCLFQAKPQKLMLQSPSLLGSAIFSGQGIPSVTQSEQIIAFLFGCMFELFQTTPGPRSTASLDEACFSCAPQRSTSAGVGRVRMEASVGRATPAPTSAIVSTASREKTVKSVSHATFAGSPLVKTIKTSESVL